MNQNFKLDEQISFERIDKGTVLLTVKEPFGNNENCYRIPANIWASLVLTMTAYNERPNDWHAFMAHHQGKIDMLAAAKMIQTIRNVLAASEAAP